MVNNGVKIGLSLAGTFLAGFTTAYQSSPQAKPVTWVMGGLAPVAGYLLGFYQINPANTPRVIADAQKQGLIS